MTKITKEQLRKLYWEDGLTYREVAKKLGVENKTVILNMRKYDIPRRTQKEAIKLSVKRGRWAGCGKGKNHRFWKGGKTFNPCGYVLLNIALLSDDEKKLFKSMFFGHNNNIILEHRLVMARNLKRTLKKEEEVHHINGVVNDNRLENLLLLDGRKHKQLIPALKRKIKELEEKLKLYEK